MTTQAAKKIKKRRQTSPLYLKVERLIRPSTGEEIKAFVAMTEWDARLLRERKLHAGSEVRAYFTKPRDIRSHKLIHKIGALLVDNVQKFELLNAHDAVKRVQRESGVMCEETTIDLGELGEHTIRQPSSIAFDELDESQFQELFTGITKYIDEHYAADLTKEVREDYALMVIGNAP